MTSPESQVCLACGKTAQGSHYQFHYGETIGFDMHSTQGPAGSTTFSTRFRMLGHKKVFICNDCGWKEVVWQKVLGIGVLVLIGVLFGLVLPAWKYAEMFVQGSGVLLFIVRAFFILGLAGFWGILISPTTVRAVLLSSLKRVFWFREPLLEWYAWTLLKDDIRRSHGKPNPTGPLFRLREYAKREQDGNLTAWTTWEYQDLMKRNRKSS
jgi:hypothetical protein